MKNSTGQEYGVAALILALLAFPLSFIPCTFVPALLFAGLGIVLSAIGLSIANRREGSKGLLITALVLSIIGAGVASVWGLSLRPGLGLANDITKQVRKEINKGFDEDWEGRIDKYGKAFEDAFNDLENEDLDWDHFGREIDDQEFKLIINEYKSVLSEYAQLLNADYFEEEQMVARATKNGIKAVAVLKNIHKISHKLTNEQKQKLTEIQQELEQNINVVNLND
ncbi:MAG: hypothetical protein HC896_06015 [Bacteroidales bacterium]|nr:hypothetical protein [Bacteroidales bacterium]